MDKTEKFDFVLTSLQNTVIQVVPKINEISRMDQEHDDYPKQEIVVFLEQLEKGKELVATCADIPRWNKYKRRKYAKAINKKLDRINIQIPEGVSGGGESSNAAATDQSSDDQTAGRQSRFEMRFRRK
ncbi:hypothetical protein LWI28_000790 [Acer negundo]|uniref:RPW8 domain-containing protein n=1 Tax=Acer negundo TaxID=4023 RepID=A0AAD5IIA9_ACENE|nr:hypothetical protein LWI28_000790 [Acer negundo]